jgi:hypothetical protein
VAIRLQAHAFLWALLKWILALTWLAHIKAVASRVRYEDWACSDDVTSEAIFREVDYAVGFQARMSGVLVAMDTLHLAWLGWCYRTQKKSEAFRLSLSQPQPQPHASRS